ncbi:MAG: hypothetical protein MUF83_20855 [Acidimicrobiales bacterium]|nr:hypothetical protein [Acidimicrobiales bacterium]
MSPPERTLEPVATSNTTAGATRAFSQSVLISGIRCSLTYVVFPWLVPLLGLAAGVGSAIGLVAGVVAIVFNVVSIRRMWITDFRLKVPLTVLNSLIIVMMLVLIGLDLADLR